MGGNAGGLMTVRGSANLLTRTTAILAALFFATAIGLTILAELDRGTARHPRPARPAPAAAQPSTRARCAQASCRAAIRSTLPAAPIATPRSGRRRPTPTPRRPQPAPAAATPTSRQRRCRQRRPPASEPAPSSAPRSSAPAPAKAPQSTNLKRGDGNIPFFVLCGREAVGALESFRIMLRPHKVKAHGSVRFHHRWRGFLIGQRSRVRGARRCAAGARLQGPAAEARPLSQRRSRHDVADPARRGVRHRRRRRDRSRPRPLRALHRPRAPTSATTSPPAASIPTSSPRSAAATISAPPCR